MSLPAQVPGLVFDDEAIEASHRAMLHEIESFDWRAKLRMGARSGGGFATFLLVQQLVSHPLARFAEHLALRIGILVVGSAFMGALSVFAHGRARQKAATGDLAASRESLAKQWHTLNGPGWRRRTVLIGMGLGAACGVPVAAFATSRPEFGLWRDSVPLTIAAFTSGMWLWSIPVAFWTRHVTLEKIRSYLLQEPRTS